MPATKDPDIYVIPAVSSRRGVVQGLLVLAGIYAIALGLTRENFFGDALGFAVAALLIVGIFRFIALENPIMRLVIGMALFGPFLLGAALTTSVPVMVDMTIAGAVILIVTFILLTPGKAVTGMRSITARRLLKKLNLSYDEIAAVGVHHSTWNLIKGQLGFGSPTISLTPFTGKRTLLGIAPTDVERFLARMAEQVEPEEDDNFFFLPTAAPVAAGTAAGGAKTSGRDAAGPELAEGQPPTEPQKKARGRRLGGKR